MNSRPLIFFILTAYLIPVQAQKGVDKNPGMRYTQAQVIDSVEGIRIYHKMMKVLEMDYVLIKQQGYEVKGWNEEYYENGQLQHISYYKEGRLVLFKNFFENGQCEHNITYTDTLNCHIDVFYPSGSIKNQIEFYNGAPKKLLEFFENGLPKSVIEYDHKKNCVSSKKSWYINAETQSELTLQDADTKTFSEKLYYPNGQLKEEGELIYSASTREYLKNNIWYTYESSGKKKQTEKYKIK